MTRYSFVKQYSSADASCAAACTSAPQTALCLFDTAALAVSFLFLRLISGTNYFAASGKDVILARCSGSGALESGFAPGRAVFSTYFEPKG